MKIKIYFSIILVISILSCARRGNPSGGPKDDDAPITIKTIPNYKTVNFNTNEIKIYFDEYIKLKDLDKNLIVSPPLKYPAIITPLGSPSKKLNIIIKDTLLANTTYTFNFGESIVDNSEGNVLKNFSYIFSTGKFIDSLSINGTVLDALSNKTDKYVSVMLYEANESFNDSTIYKEKPRYITNTLDSISWQINNIRKGKYHLIALKEENKNYLFNPKSDKIAFIDSIINIPTEKEFNLTLFREVLKFKSFKPIEVSKGRLLFGFEGTSDEFIVKTDLIKSGIKNITDITFFEKGKDSLNYYYKLDKNVEIDSLVFNISSKIIKSTESIILRSKKVDTLIIKNNLKGTLHFRDTLKISTNNPLSKFNKSQFSIIDKDTIAVDFSLNQLNHRQLLVLFQQKESQSYKMQLLPDAITDFFNQTNKDTLNYSFKTKNKDKYGSISLKINSNEEHLIVQLLSLKGKIIAETTNIKNSKVAFELLSPNKYLIRIIIDKNNNGIWDTGNYLKKNQPEKVIYFNGEIEVKENWFVNEDIDIK